MMQLTEEQRKALIDFTKQRIEALHFSIKQHAFESIRAPLQLELAVAEIALASLTAKVPPVAELSLTDYESTINALAKLNNELYRWTSRMSYNESWVGEPEGLIKGHIREMEKILDAAMRMNAAAPAEGEE